MKLPGWAQDQDFLSKLHAAWEDCFKPNPELILILCGSVSAWIEKNILIATGYFGRISIKLTLQKLSLQASNMLLTALGFKGSLYERLMLFASMGGVPWYLEQIDPGLNAEKNIQQLCFTREGLLVDEFYYIFNDLFPERRREVNKKIIMALAKGALDYNAIEAKINYSSSGALSDYLDKLEQLGFVQRDYNWNFKTKQQSSLSRYRLRDNYLRFFLKYISPRLGQIHKQQFLDVSLSSLPGFDTVMGLQIENLILNNRCANFQSLSINSNDIINDNPYFQNPTSKYPGCQIDYLIQTKYNALYICEVKLSRNTIRKSIIGQMQDKISKLKVPKGFAYLPVLVVASEVEQGVLDEDYFIKIIDMRDLL